MEEETKEAGENLLDISLMIAGERRHIFITRELPHATQYSNYAIGWYQTSIYAKRNVLMALKNYCMPPGAGFVCTYPMRFRHYRVQTFPAYIPEDRKR